MTTIQFPTHAVVTDHKTRSVVVAIRGTMSVTDAIIDCMCEREAFPEVHKDMFAHSGILKGGRAVYAKVLANFYRLPSVLRA